jgi:hypothetical protein
MKKEEEEEEEKEEFNQMPSDIIIRKIHTSIFDSIAACVGISLTY